MLHIEMFRCDTDTNKNSNSSFDQMVYLHDSGRYMKCFVVTQKPITIVTLHLTQWCTYSIQAVTFRSVPFLL